MACYGATVSENKAINVHVPPAVAERLRREAFEDRVSQGSVVAHALTRLWENRNCTCEWMHDHECPVVQIDLARADG